MTKWILKWNDACGESNGEECIDSKEELKERIEEIKDEYTIEDLEWEAKKAEVCPCCKEWVIKGKVKKKNLLKEYAIDLKERDEQMKRQGAIEMIRKIRTCGYANDMSFGAWLRGIDKELRKE